MKPAKGWKKLPLEEVLEDKEVNDQFATLFREKKFSRLPNLVGIHVNGKKQARWVFANTLCESAKDALLIYTEREKKDKLAPVSTLSIFAKEGELEETTLLLQEMEPPPQMKPLSFVGHTKKGEDGKEKQRVMADKNEVGAMKHSITVMVAGDRIYLDKWTEQAMNECEVAFERNKEVPQIISHIMIQPTFDKRGKEARNDATTATLRFNLHLKQNEKKMKPMEVDRK